MSVAEKFLRMAHLAVLAKAREGGTGEGGTGAAPERREERGGAAGGPFRGVPSRRPLAAEVVTSMGDQLPTPRVLASYPEHQVVAGGRKLSRGAGRLWVQLHRLACDVGRARLYDQVPRSITFHCPAVTLCGLLGVTDRHLRRLAAELERCGLLDSGGHAQQVAGRSMYDGTLWAVLVSPGAEAPRIRADEWKHQWRPGFLADVEGKTGAAAEMSELLKAEADEAEKYHAVKARAAVPGAQNPPPLSSSDILPRPSLRAVVEGLAQLWHLHSSKRSRAVGLLASQIAAALVEPERRRYWCRVIWDALRSEHEQRGGLQVLGAQLSRLAADLQEGAPWKNPGAILAARLKTA